MMLCVLLCAIILLAITSPSEAAGAPPEVTFSAPGASIERYGIAEVAVRVRNPSAENPFTGVSLTGAFRAPGGTPVYAEGFCDAEDGSTYRIRFMPSRPGLHTYSVTWRQGDLARTHSGAFEVREAGRKGILRVDPEHPWHFQWEGTGEHFFWNGTTTYFLLGWDDETMLRSVDRLAGLKVNYLRVAICGRVKDGRAWFENVYPTDRFSFLLNPWKAARPDSVENPGFDPTRFNVEHWRKIERLLRHAREKDVLVSVVFYVDGARPGTEPFGKARAGGPDEQRYYAYAVARLAAYSNVMWDVTNEYQLFRDEAWANRMGAFLKAHDPYDHLTSVHGHGQFPFRTQPWADFAMYQQWDEGGGYDFMLRNRREQEKTGRAMPQVNEEYGYEDHYPTWGGNRKAPSRSADNRRRLAWEMTMAGGYQTTGERADQGTGWGADTGGGWINGRGDDAMVMLKGYGYMVDFFTRLPWWTLEPGPDLAEAPARCHADPGRLYVLYLPEGKRTAVRLEPGRYAAKWYNPRTGAYTPLPWAEGPAWSSPAPPDRGDWALLLRRRTGAG